MLNNAIQFHILDDEAEQQALEQQAAARIQYLQHIGLEAFKRYMPSLVSVLVSNNPNAATILCNAFGEINIVDYKSGRVLYGPHPQREVEKHLSRALASNKAVALPNCSGQPESLIVVLGLGLGHHLPMILNSISPKHLIVYEPNTAYLKCSLAAIDWRALFQQAQQQGTAIYLQIGKDGRDVYHDVQELTQRFPVHEFHWYKHLNHPVFDQTVSAFTEKSWSDFAEWYPDLKQLSSVTDYVAPWSQFLESTEWRPEWLDEDKRNRNLFALAPYFPELHKEFLNYKPNKWYPVANREGHVNLCYRESQALFYSDQPAEESLKNLSEFIRRPHKDGLVLGYSGKKLKSYLHYKLVAECEEIIKSVDEVEAKLPEDVKSLIHFGLGAGYSLELLLQHRNVEKLFVCEPNKDFFFASLYAIDWAGLLENFNKNTSRLYLNIGDDGSHLVEDLLIQFQTIGPYVLASTFFYQGYYNERLSNAVTQLREQLQVIIAMGDYFDHAKYGIAHTKCAIDRDYPFLLKDAKNRLSARHKNIPVFIVGNGPSLDNLIGLIKCHQNEAIIISCGTALQTLHRHQIVPDFHAEIEMNRSTYDWCVRIGDLDYLNRISLISCNGIHPDTCDLFKNAFLAFKQGEASTVSILTGKLRACYATLEHAYPTVSNFAADIITQLGFDQIYLLGVDLGFIDKNHHHSISSGYYDVNGTQRYEYSDENHTSLVIPGNFRNFVNTKYEFKIAKAVLEQIFCPINVDVYNLNDGAKIYGSNPLKIDDVLISSTKEEKDSALVSVKNNCFGSLREGDEFKAFLSMFEDSVLIDEINELIHLVSKFMNESALDGVDRFVENQRALLVSTVIKKSSLLFFYLNGTLNYINSVLIKVASITNENKKGNKITSVLKAWYKTLLDISFELVHNKRGFDGVSSFAVQRRSVKVKDYFLKVPTSIDVVHDVEFVINTEYRQYIRPHKGGGKNVNKIVFQSCFNGETIDKTCSNILVIDAISERDTLKIRDFDCVVVVPGDISDDMYSCIANDFSRLNFAILALTFSQLPNILIPKLIVDERTSLACFKPWVELSREYVVYNAYDYVAFFTTGVEYLINGVGDLLTPMRSLKLEDLVLESKSREEHSKLKQAFANGLENIADARRMLFISDEGRS